MLQQDYLNYFLDPTKRVSRLEGLGEKEIRQNISDTVRSYVHLAAKESPLVLMLDDVHWADQSSLDLFEHLLHGSEKTHLLLLLVHRPDFDPPWSDKLNYNEIRLEPFERMHISDFVCRLLEVDRISRQIESELLRLSRGNPLFIEEILRQLLVDKTIDIQIDENGKRFLRFSKQDTIALPVTLNAIIASRFDRLPEVEREVLRWASIIGHDIQASELEQLASEILDSSTEDIFQILINKNYLNEKSVFSEAHL